MEQALRNLLTETVGHAVYLSQDAYGKPTYAAAQPRLGRLEEHTQRVTTAQGQERVTRARLFLDGLPAVGLRDQLTLPDGTQPEILSLSAVRSLQGSIHHYEILL